MTRTLLVAPTGHRVGLTSTSLGLVAALDRAGAAVGYAKPIAQPGSNGDDNSSVLVGLTTRLETPPSIPVERAEKLLGAGRLDDLMEEVVAVVDSVPRCDIVVVEGLVPSPDSVWSRGWTWRWRGRSTPTSCSSPTAAATPVSIWPTR